MTYLKMIAPRTLMFAVLALPCLIANAYAQQEVDPTWYDPWAGPKPVATQTIKTAEKKQALKVKTAAAKPSPAKPMPARAAKKSANGQVMLAAK
jgi:hypothetical protein